ncbi:hypothetical protein TNCT_99881 [Trichonephila clavata]|uniref:Uncharacterized protein n=1 Tax=Trichonephila clavata TaxID=2740835 RepID=A0A8X6GCW5_TRICU|nr:hypothetical protein TNCT_99881 [Trichonephila clavata]
MYAVNNNTKNIPNNTWFKKSRNLFPYFPLSKEGEEEVLSALSPVPSLSISGIRPSRIREMVKTLPAKGLDWATGSRAQFPVVFEFLHKMWGRHGFNLLRTSRSRTLTPFQHFQRMVTKFYRKVSSHECHDSWKQIPGGKEPQQTLLSGDG